MTRRLCLLLQTTGKQREREGGRQAKMPVVSKTGSCQVGRRAGTFRAATVAYCDDTTRFDLRSASSVSAILGAPTETKDRCAPPDNQPIQRRRRPAATMARAHTHKYVPLDRNGSPNAAGTAPSNARPPGTRATGQRGGGGDVLVCPHPNVRRQFQAKDRRDVLAKRRARRGGEGEVGRGEGERERRKSTKGKQPVSLFNLGGIAIV